MWRDELNQLFKEAKTLLEKATDTKENALLKQVAELEAELEAKLQPPPRKRR